MNIKSSITKKLLINFLVITAPLAGFTQESKILSLEDALKLGLSSSKELKLSKSKIEEAESVYQQTKDNTLPTAKASALYNHAEIPNNTLQIGEGNPIHLPSRADAFLGTFSLEQLIFAGNRLKYAKESSDLLKRTAQLDLEKNKNEIALSIIDTYLSLYKLQSSKEVITQNLTAIDKQLSQTKRFFEQGIVTKNDVLRLQLQKANVELTGIDIDKNENIVNYNLDLLIGIPESTKIRTIEPVNKLDYDQKLESYVSEALKNREELKQADYRIQIADNNIKSVKSSTLPTLGAGVNAYYINPSGKFIPSNAQFITPVTVAANLSWDIGSLWTHKNKLSQAHIQKEESKTTKDIFEDRLKSEVNNNYQQYKMALSKIQIIKASIDQAEENNRIVASKYANSTASITDRIDADTQLFQTKINLEIAKADANLAYFNLLKTSGQLVK